MFRNSAKTISTYASDSLLRYTPPNYQLTLGKRLKVMEQYDWSVLKQRPKFLPMILFSRPPCAFGPMETRILGHVTHNT